MPNEVVTRNVLWADDDANNALESIARLLRKRGKFSLVVAEDYRHAVEALDHAAAAAPNDRLTGMIVDTMLPSGNQDAAVDNYLGIKLAQLAASAHKIHAIVFLSVVPHGEIADHFADLQSRYPHVSFAYFDKLALFEGSRFDELLASVTVANAGT